MPADSLRHGLPTFEQWKNHRHGLDRRQDLYRLDELNPFRWLDRFDPQATEQTPDDGAPSLDTVCSAWADRAGVGLDPSRVLPTLGVRDFLSIWSRWSGRRGRGTLRLPEDVYPTYWRLTDDPRINRRGIRTLPTFDLESLGTAGPDDTLLLPLPLSPLGRNLDSAEVECLADWLRASDRRSLMLDLVYADDGGALPGLAELRESGQCIEIWSISKTWLQRRMFGVAVLPPMLPPSELRPFRNTDPRVSAARALAALERQPEMPSRLQAAVRARWNELSPVLRRLDPTWTAPRSGYFSLLRFSAHTLLETHGLAAVPASVFGSRDPNLSVITCLHDLRPLASSSLESGRVLRALP